MTTKNKALEKNEIAALMGCKPASAISRLVALGYTEVCTRCGGCGQYSWNQIDGSRCFGCAGSGKKLAKITAEIVAKALERIAAGELDGYFAENKARREMAAADKALWATYMGSPIGTAYEVGYKAMCRAVTERAKAGLELRPDGGLLETPVGRAQTLQNRIMDRARTFSHAHKNAPEAKLTHVERIAKVREAQAMIVELNRIWTAEVARLEQIDRLAAQCPHAAEAFVSQK